MRANTLITQPPAHGGVPPISRSNWRSGWLVWAVSAVFVLFQFFLQLSSGEMVEGLMHSFSITALGAGLLASSYYYIYVCLQTPAGMLVDRYGPRRLLTMGAMIVTVGCFLFADAHDLPLAFVGRLLMGTGAAFAFVGSMNLVARWFPAERFGLMVAIAETIGMLGSLIGGFFLADLIQHVGWRDCIFGAAAIGLVIAYLLWWVVRDRPANVTPIIARSSTCWWSDVKELIKKPAAWINGAYSGLMFGVLSVFVALWGIPFMQYAHHLSLMWSTLVCNLVFIGVAVGGPLQGWVDKTWQQRRLVLVGSSLACCIILSILVYLPGLSLFIVVPLMLLLGVGCSSYITTFIVANEIATHHTRSTSIGFVNSLSVGTAPLLQPLIGLILYLVASGHAVVNYTVYDYEVALSVMPLMMVVAMVLAWFIPAKVNRT